MVSSRCCWQRSSYQLARMFLPPTGSRAEPRQSRPSTSCGPDRGNVSPIKSRPTQRGLVRLTEKTNTLPAFSLLNPDLDRETTCYMLPCTVRQMIEVEFSPSRDCVISLITCTVHVYMTLHVRARVVLFTR